jgi:hypothetical protein
MPRWWSPAGRARRASGGFAGAAVNGVARLSANRAQAAMDRKADSLRSTPAGAIWRRLPARDRHLLLWLLTGDVTRAVTIVTKRGCRAPVRLPVRVPVREWRHWVERRHDTATRSLRRRGERNSLRYPSPVGSQRGDPELTELSPDAASSFAASNRLRHGCRSQDCPLPLPGRTARRRRTRRRAPGALPE